MAGFYCYVIRLLIMIWPWSFLCGFGLCDSSGGV